MFRFKPDIGKRAFKMIKSWLPFRKIYHIDNTNSIVARSYFGGPNIATTVEEFSSSCVKEFILWGYCGAIDKALRIGDLLIVQRALREDGVSYHYHEDDSEEAVFSNWYEDLIKQAKTSNLSEAYVWTVMPYTGRQRQRSKDSGRWGSQL
jgi:uridine phosphorylase